VTELSLSQGLASIHTPKSPIREKKLGNHDTNDGMDHSIEALLKGLAADALKQQEELSKKQHNKKIAEV
jgi:hypothetical protein